MTEAEAKNKWCPLVRFTDKDASALGNRSLRYWEPEDPVDSRAMCIGSACMAWRWSETLVVTRERYRLGMGPDLGKIRNGHCGAFGSEEPI